MAQHVKRFKRRDFVAGLITGVAALPLLAACAAPPAPTATTAPAKPTAAPAAPTVAPAAPAATTAPAQPTAAPAAPAATTAPAQPTAAPAATTAPAKPTAAPAAQAPAPAKLTGKITILVGGEYGLVTPETKTPIAKSMLALFDKYQKDVQPGVKIELEDLQAPQGVVYYEVLRTRALAGNIPDLAAFEPRPSTMNTGLFYQIPRALLDSPNPYSTNKTWWADFPYDGAAFGGYAGYESGSYWTVAMTLTGGGGALGVGYNRDLFAKAGIPPALNNPPKSWAEFMDWHKKLKAIGVVPFDVGNRGGGPWFHGAIYDNIIEDHHDKLDGESATFFGEKPTGMMAPKQGVYLFKTNRWRFDDEHTEAYFDIHKEWTQYFRPGFLADSTKNQFVLGEAAMTFALVNQAYEWPELLKGKFKWGIFLWPSITKDTWAHAPGLPQRPPGATGQSGSYARGAQYMIPQQTVKSGRLDLAVNLLQWLTAPTQLAEFSKTVSPRSAPPNALVKEVYPEDEEEQHHWQFRYEPRSILEGNKRYGWEEWWHNAGPGLEDPMIKTNQAFLAGQLATSKAAAAELQKQALLANERWVAQNPDFKPAPSTWK